MKKIFSIFLILLSFHLSAQQSDVTGIHDPNTVRKHKLKKKLKKFDQLLQVETFEDNLIGYTKDNDDQAFLDFTLSAAYRLWPFDSLRKAVHCQQNLHLYFSFTCRLGQYIGTRYSSPVVGKRFNPQLFFEYSPKEEWNNLKLRLAYGHESNGQQIDDPSAFYAIARSTVAKNFQDAVSQTIDHISRGWDYIGFNGIYDFQYHPGESRIILEPELGIRYYLDNGLMEGPKEEYRSWEQPWYGNRFTRNEVSGINMSFTYYSSKSRVFKVRASYETGITAPFSNSTFRLLAGVRLLSLPLAITYTNGYNGDLAQYGKRNSSLGITFVLASFATPFLNQEQ